MKKRKVFYIHEGVFGSYKKDSSTRTAADHIAAGKELAKKAIIDKLVKDELPKILQKALPTTIKRYSKYLTNYRINMTDIGLIPINSWDSRKYYGPKSNTFGNDWDNTGIYIDRNGNNVDIKIPLAVSAGSYIGLCIGSDLKKLSLLEFRKMLASDMAPKIDEVEAEMLALGLHLDIKFYLTKMTISADNDDDWPHVPEITELDVAANAPFVDEQAVFNIENRRMGGEPFSAYIQRQQFNGYGVITELLDSVDIPRIHWNSATRSEDMPVEEIASELGKICKVFNPSIVHFIVRAARRLRENRGRYNDAMDKLDSISSLVSSMPENSKLFLTFIYACDQDFSDLSQDDTLVSDALCKEIFGMNHAEVVDHVLNVLDAKQTKQEQNKGIVCQRAYISEIYITVGSTLSSSQIEVKVAKVNIKASDATKQNINKYKSPNSWRSTGAASCKWTR